MSLGEFLSMLFKKILYFLKNTLKLFLWFLEDEPRHVRLTDRGRKAVKLLIQGKTIHCESVHTGRKLTISGAKGIQYRKN